ncbi:MAG: flagellin [Candidatus Zixiibacteriota bacterium]
MMSSLVSNHTARPSLSAIRSAYARMFSALQQLSSGWRINSAADDPAGLVISEQLRSRIASLNAEIESISQSIGRYQAASSTTLGLHDQLRELRALAVGAANEGGNDPVVQEAFVTSAAALVESYNRTVRSAEYGGQLLFGTHDGALANIGELTGVDLSSGSLAVDSLTIIDEATRELDAVEIHLASEQKYGLESRRDSLEVTRENLIAAESRLRDADFADVYSNFVAGMIQTKATLAMLAHSTMLGSEIANLFKR